MSQKTICIVSSFGLPHVGGVERYSHQLAKKFVEHGHQVVLVCLNTDHVAESEVIDGVIYFRFPSFALLKGRLPIPFLTPKFFRILNLINDYIFDFCIINVKFYVLSLLSSWYSKHRKIPSILIEHGSDHFERKNPLIQSLANFYEHGITFLVKQNISHFYGVSQACNHWLAHFGITARGVIYNGVDINYLPDSQASFRARYGFCDSTVLISYVGRLVPEKGIMELVEAVTSLLAEGQDLALLIAGDDPFAENIKTIPGRLIRLGRISHDSVLSLLSESDILVLPSRFPEGLPTILLEAGKMGCAVIATPMGGTREVVPDEDHGLIIEDNRADTIRRALLELIIDSRKRKRLQINLQKRVEEVFDWDIIYQHLMDEITPRMK